jgi:hypothetical protein
MMLVTMVFHDEINPEHSVLIGYTTMVLSFLLIYFGVRSYRDNVAGGRVGFGRAFTVAILIGAVASACYVAAWEVYFFNYNPDFLTKYQARELARARERGESDAEIAKRQAADEKLARIYQNPIYNSAMTFMEPFPVALVVSLVSAGVLSRRRTTRVGQGESIAGSGAPATR